MPASRYRLLSPLAALLSGAAIALLVRSGRPAAPHSAAAFTATTSSSSGPASPQHPATKIVRTRGHPAPDATAYAAAWQSLHYKAMPLAERRQLEQLLLAEWSVLDLEAALSAAVASFIPGGDFWPSQHLILHCAPGVAAHPELARQIIDSHVLGPDTAHLRSAWIEAFSASAPEQVLAAVPDMPTGFRSHAIQAVCRELHAPDASPDQRREIMARLFDRAGNADGDKMLEEASAAVGLHSGNDILRLSLLSASDPVEVDFYQRALAYRMFVTSSADSDEILASLPESVRPAVAAEYQKIRER